MRWASLVVACALVVGACSGGGPESGAPNPMPAVDVTSTAGAPASTETTPTSTASSTTAVSEGSDVVSSAEPAGGGESEPAGGSSTAVGETVWEVIERSRADDLDVNDPDLLAAFDSQIADIRDVWELADVVDDVETVFADDYIDGVVRDSLLARLADVKSGLRGESGTTGSDEVASLETDTQPAGTTTTTTQPAVRPTEPASLASGITPVPYLFLHEYQQTHDRDTMPRPDRIVVSPPDETGMVSVHGGAGAIPYQRRPDGGGRPWDEVIVAAVEWGTQDCAGLEPDGSFDAQLEAASGSTLYVLPVHEGNCTDIGLSDGPVTVLTIPWTTPRTADSDSFETLGRLRTGSRWTRWSAQGSLFGPDRSVEFAFVDGPPQECFIPRIHLYRLFDHDGGYLTQVNVNIHGPALTPTGLPIESKNGAAGFYDIIEFVDAPNCLKSDLTMIPGDLPASLEQGWYLPRIMFGKITPSNPIEFSQSENAPQSDGVPFMLNTGFGYLPMFGVGDPVLPRLPATLLNSATSWGTAGRLGIVATEDTDQFALGSRRTDSGPFIASPTNPLSGQQIHYTLEPYLPTVGYTGFVRLPEPLFSLDANDPGNLSISLTTPDGDTRDLALDAKVHMFIASAWETPYPSRLSFSGPSHTIGLTTFLDDVDLEFEQFGRHTVRLDGTLRSSRGDDFTIEGTYGFWVAEPLDLSLGVFEGTPLEVGDAWNPVVIVEPGVPADISVEITHYVNGDPNQRQNHSVTGTANQFGYFQSADHWQPSQHGEYRINVTASYVDPVDGTLWMGTRSTASIVATPDTPLIAHGDRNSGLADDDIMRTWFFMRSLDPTCGSLDCEVTGSDDDNRGGHIYPFFSGDVAWITDLQPINPIVTVAGPEDVLSSVAPQLGPASYCPVVVRIIGSGCGSSDIEVPDNRQVFSDTGSGSGIHHRPNDVTSWAYWYSTSIRPDVSVFAAAAEFNGGEHNQWYGHDNYNCQIGLACGGFFRPTRGFRSGSDSEGDEEGDVKLLFGGAVLKNDDQQHFVPYASMGVIIEETTCTDDGTCTFGDSKGARVCPPYQGAVGGLGTCGPLLTHRGRDVDLFITPTGTRPGSVLEPGDRFTFSGQAWPTLDVAVEVTVTGPEGEIHRFENRANVVGYVDPVGMSFVVETPGVYEVHVSAVQDRPVPSTGLAPDPALVADGRTTLGVYGYQHPLSAVLGTEDSTYYFYVTDQLSAAKITSTIPITSAPNGDYVERITFTHTPPAGVTDGHYSLTAPGLLIEQGTISGSGTFTLEVDQRDLYEAGFTQIILGADTLQLSMAYQTDTGWYARTLNQRGFSPLGG
jgi:hypothetical protein